ncbi:lanthionine synthetase C family protein [Streptomyces indonesiensis]
MTRSYKEQAQDAVRLIKRALADQDFTVHHTHVPAAASMHGRDELLWDDLSLTSGYAGVSLAFSGARSGQNDDVLRAHEYLSAGAYALSVSDADPHIPQQRGMYLGVGSLAFATLMAHRARSAGYINAMAHLDQRVKKQARWMVECSAKARLSALADFDVTRGLSGIGRYLLARGAAGETELRLILSRFVELSQRVPFRGHRVPGWWALEGPRGESPQGDFSDGHLNLGLAHGICGPLVLLATAYSSGVIVEGQREAIEEIVGVLLDSISEDAHGIYWPRLMTLTDWSNQTSSDRYRPRPSWCYGTPGVTRAIQLAALALQNSNWHEIAAQSLLSLLSIPLGEMGIQDASLCHGWASLLHMVRACNHVISDDRLTDFSHRIAERILSELDEEAPFGFRAAMLNVPQGADVPGFLEGATGISLALESYATDSSHPDWEMCMLIA